MPSSKCTQVSLAMGDIYNDLKVILGGCVTEPAKQKLIMKCLSDKARELDHIIQQTEKDTFDYAWKVATGADKPKEGEKF